MNYIVLAMTKLASCGQLSRNSDDFASFKQSIDYLTGIDELSSIRPAVPQILCMVNKLQSIITEKNKQI